MPAPENTPEPDPFRHAKDHEYLTGLSAAVGLKVTEIHDLDSEDDAPQGRVPAYDDADTPR